MAGQPAVMPSQRDAWLSLQFTPLAWAGVYMVNTPEVMFLTLKHAAQHTKHTAWRALVSWQGCEVAGLIAEASVDNGYGGLVKETLKW